MRRFKWLIMISKIILNVEQALWYNDVHGLDICIRTHQVLFIHFLSGCVLLDKNITILVCTATQVCTDLLCWLNYCNYRNLVSRNKFSSSPSFLSALLWEPTKITGLYFYWLSKTDFLTTHCYYQLLSKQKGPHLPSSTSFSLLWLHQLQSWSENSMLTQAPLYL